MRNFGPNVVIFIITSGRKRWYGVWDYLLPISLPTINWIKQALEWGPKGVGKLLVGNLNTCLANSRGHREEQLAPVLAGHGIMDQA